MGIELLNIASDDRWRMLLDELPDDRRDVYFSPEYYRADAVGKDVEAECVVYRAGDELVLYPFLKRGVNALGLGDLDQDYFDIEGAYGYNGVQASSQDPSFIAGFFGAFSAFCREHNIVAEFTRFHPLLKNYDLAREFMNVTYLHETVCVDLGTPHEELWDKSYNSKNRNMIRKAIKHGVECRRTQDWSAFIEMYNATMRNLDADTEYYFPAQYYEILKQGFGSGGKCLLLEAVFDGEPIAGLLLMVYGKYAHYHLSARNPQYSRLAAGNLLLDYAIRTARELGAESMHLGGGMSQDDSLMRYKAGFSPERGAFYIGKKVHNQDIYEQLCAAWAAKYPDKVDTYRNYFLKYRK